MHFCTNMWFSSPAATVYEPGGGGIQASGRLHTSCFSPRAVWKRVPPFSSESTICYIYAGFDVPDTSPKRYISPCAVRGCNRDDCSGLWNDNAPCVRWNSMTRLNTAGFFRPLCRHIEFISVHAFGTPHGRIAVTVYRRHRKGGH